METLQGFRLSPQQRRVWRLQEGRGAAYRTQCALLLDGRLDESALDEALRRLFSRHEILRTSFQCLPGMRTPVQRIEERVRPALERIDLTGFAGPDQDAELARLFDEDLHSGGGASAHRIALLGLDERRHVLFFGLSALCADAWSLQLLAGEVARICAGEPPAVDDADVLQYADFAEWQNELMEGDAVEEARAYWRTLDPASLPRPVYPFERRAPGPAEELGTVVAAIGEQVAARLEELAAALGAPLASVLTAAWMTLLWRISGEPEVGIGRVVDGRKHEDLHHGVGQFARCLPCRVRIEEGQGFRRFAAGLAESLREADGWQEYFDPEEAAGWGPEGLRLPIGFAWEERQPPAEAGGLRVSTWRQQVRNEPFALDLTCVREGGALTSVIRYDAALCDSAAVERLAAQWRTLLDDVARRPDAAVRDLEILSGEEWLQVVAGFNRTGAELPDARLHELVERQAARNPEAVALVAGHESVTYRELNRRANQLAHHLRARGIAPEVTVGIALERSPAMVVALLGTLKAGGAALPLDLQSPSSRLAHVLADARARALVTEERLLRELPSFLSFAASGRSVVCLDRDASALAAEPDSDPPALGFPENLAYVTYTSGSTGQPKGVLSTHRGAVSYIDFVLREYEVGPASVVLQVAALSFDASVRDILGPLAAGARVVLVREDEARNPGALLARIREHRVDTILSMVPTLFRALAQAAREDELPWSALRSLVLSGESLFQADLRSARRLFGEAVSVVNQYGPTECTMTSSYWRQTVAGEPEGERELAPIGRPIQNARFYVVDAQMAPVPIGVAGELLIGGIGVTRGYCNRPELTADKFVPSPFGGEQGDRLYRTGDVARWLPDGNLEFLGRRDRQLKIRGVRVELDEIEALLGGHSDLREAAVVVFPEGPGLVAYVVPGDRRSPATAELRGFLRDRLPEPMVPAHYVVLPGLPRTSTGKVDRGALPAPERVRQAEQRPRTEVEDLLSVIWSQVLGVEEVGLEDGFFELGGHSLLAAQLTARVQEAFGTELPLRALFEAPTVASLARRVESAMGTGRDRPSPALQRVARGGVFGGGGALPVSFAQHRLWFLQRLDPDTCAFNIPRAVRLRGPLGDRGRMLLERAMNEIVRRHETLRTTFIETAGEPWQVIAPPVPMTLPLVDLASLPDGGGEAARLILDTARTPFDLAAGPLLRAGLLRLGAEEHLLFFNIHHIVSDDWSMGVLLGELSALYDAFSRGEGSPLPELAVQYADYAAWQRQWLQGEVLEERLAYWRRKLSGRLPVLRLPFGRPRPAQPGYGGARQSFTLPAPLARSLGELGRAEGATLFMVLLAAFQTLLHRYTGEEDVAVGTDVANRSRVDTEALIGFFVNVLVLRTDLGGDPTFRELLRRVREVALGAFTHQDVPFDRLVEELQPDRGSRTPFFQYLLVLQNARRRRLDLSGLELESLELDNGTAKFDLVLVLLETDQGLTGIWNYSTDLFDAQSISRLTGHLTTLLESIVAQPDARLGQLEFLPAREREQEAMEKKQRKQADLAKFMNVQPKAVQLSRSALVTMEPMAPGRKLPLLVRPAGEAVRLADWVRANGETLEGKLLEHGAILFRGFGLETAEQFEEVARAFCPELFEEYGDLPRDAVSGKVYTSTPYPPEHTIWFHNESSQLDSWPLKQFFFCVQPAAEGGTTPIADCRQVYEQLDPEVRDRFDRLGVMYVRNYTPGLDVDWRDFFHTSDRAEVEAQCRRSAIDFEWKADGGLRTRKICPAVASHPRTGEKLFFNQIQAHHIACLPPEDRRSLLDLFAFEDLPRNVYYGDGTPIEDSLIQEIVATYQRIEVTFPWQKGDLLMVDNMLTAHGRYPYAGPRKILVAMSEMVSIDAVWTAERRLSLTERGHAQ
jgi:amino acid adenylation domain-containing protein